VAKYDSHKDGIYKFSLLAKLISPLHSADAVIATLLFRQNNLSFIYKEHTD